MFIPVRLAPPQLSPAVASNAVSTSAKGTAATAVIAQEPEEWSLLELNGTLSASLPNNGGGGSSNAAAGVGLGGLSLGQLSFPAPDKPVLVIGAHKLEGEIKKLPKPFLIMQKQRRRERPAGSGEPVTPGGGYSSSKRRVSGSGLQTPMSNGRATPTPNSVDSCSTGLVSPSPRQEEEEQDGGNTEFIVVGIVHQKLLFQNRPKPIVSKHLIR